MSLDCTKNLRTERFINCLVVTKIMAKTLTRILGTSLIEIPTIFGGLKLVEYGRKIGESIINSQGQYIKELGGEILSNTLEYGPTVALGTVAATGLVLTGLGTWELLKKYQNSEESEDDSENKENSEYPEYDGEIKE